jgi:thioredoxin-related protein
MFTSEKDSLTKVFAHTYGLDTIKNVQVISDEKNEMHAAFGVKSIPTIFIYDAKGKLLKRYNGETKIEAILKALDL